MKKFLAGLLVGLIVFFVSKYNWKGPTVVKRLDGIQNVSPETRSFIGVDPKTKLEYQYYFTNFTDFQIYHDAPSADKQYVTWKENRLTSWNVQAHVYP